MDWTILRLTLQLSNQELFVWFSPQHQLTNGPYVNLTLKMPSCMVLFQKTYIWNNPQEQLIHNTHHMCASSKRLFMVSNKHPVPGLIGSVSSFLNMGSFIVLQIHHFLSFTLALIPSENLEKNKNVSMEERILCFFKY